MSKRPHMLTRAAHLVMPMPEAERAPLAAGGGHAVLQRGTVRHSRTEPAQTPSERLRHETQQAASRASSAVHSSPTTCPRPVLTRGPVLGRAGGQGKIRPLQEEAPPSSSPVVPSR